MQTALEQSLAQAPDGQESVDLFIRQQRHHVVYWFVPTDGDYRPALGPDAALEVRNGTTHWRDASKVINNLDKFPFARPIVELLRRRFPTTPPVTDCMARG